MTEWFPWVTDVLLKTLVLAVMLVGLFGLLIPLIPGLVFIWLAALVYGLFGNFTPLGWVMFALITILMIVGSVIDNVLMGTKAHKSGAPWWVVLVAFFAAIIGTFLIPIPVIGGLFSALLVLFLIEWARRKDARKAWKSLVGMLSGYGWAIMIRFIMGLFMIGFWLIWAFV